VESEILAEKTQRKPEVINSHPPG